jgi:hypothetical protein
MAPDLVRLVARRNVHRHDKEKESIQPLSGTEWMPVPSAASGTPAGLSPSIPHATDATESGVGSAEDRRDDLHGRRKSARWLPSKSA